MASAMHRLARRGLCSSASSYLARCRLAARQELVRHDGADWPSSIGKAYVVQQSLHENMVAAGHRVVGNKVGEGGS